MNPQNVTTRWRRVAFAIAVTLLAGFVAYSVWTIVTAVRKRDDPPTQSRLVRRDYKLPIFVLCPDVDLTVNISLPSVICEAELRDPKRPSQPFPGLGDGFVGCSVAVSGASDEGESVSDVCVIVNAERNITLRTRRDRVSLAFQFSYRTADNPDDFGEVVRQLTPRAFEMYIVEKLDDSFDTPELLPFPGVTIVALQRTEFSFLDKSKNYVDYSATQVNAQPANANAGNASFLETDADSSFVKVEFGLASLTVQLVEENDPLEITVLIGAISGFWGIVGAAWGAVFVPAEAERLKPRWDRNKEDGDSESKNSGTEMAKVPAGESSKV